VFGVYVISGHHQGTMWGFKGDGKPLEILAFFYRTFDPQGRTTENYFHTEELQLYVALGGKAEFPKAGIAAQVAGTPQVGSGPAPERGRPAPPPELTSWPPAQWPPGVKNPKLIKWLTSAHWTEEEKKALWTALHANAFVAGDPNTPQDFTVAPFCGISCTRRRGFDYLDYLSGIHGYNAARSIRDRFVETDDIIAKGSRVIRVFKGSGHLTGYMYGFPGDGRPLEFIEIGTGNAGVGGRSEELQLFVAMGGKLQFPGKPPVP